MKPFRPAQSRPSPRVSPCTMRSGRTDWREWTHRRMDSTIREQRDIYKCAHTHPTHLITQAFTATEIAEAIKLPASTAGARPGGGYNGHTRHNVKAIYQKYLG